ncbi:MAG: RNA polymerase factor sigma-54 [Campylobacterales bacterium]|nr:RNA polymerase factor sigma-54 [Campylobacterales bacterium]
MLKQEHLQKQTARLSMKLWLPILESSLSELSKNVDELSLSNPCVTVKRDLENELKLKNKDVKKFSQGRSYGLDDATSSALVSEESLYDKLLSQIEDHLFPTEKSKEVAKNIVQNLDENGFFDGDILGIADEYHVDSDYVEKIRERFAYLEPCGVGAKDVKEALYFQLLALDVDEKMFDLVKALIYGKDEALKSKNIEALKEAKKILSRLKTVPTIEYQESDAPVIPDVAVVFEKDRFEVRLNSLYYPDIIVDKSLAHEGGEFAKEKVKEALMASNLINLRKTTLQKIVNIIIEKQFKFFLGGELVPLKIQDVADILGYNQSTISRAVANKYLTCDRGIFAFRYFFSFAVSENVSTNELKAFVKHLVESENKEKPLNDEEMLEMVQKRFGVKMVRRSITKYRLELKIPSSKERKKDYMLA